MLESYKSAKNYGAEKASFAPTLETSAGSFTQSGNTFSLTSGSQLTFANLKKANLISFSLKTSQQGNTGLIFAYSSAGDNGLKIAFEPENSQLAAYVVTAGGTQLVNRLPFEFDAAHTYNIKISISNDICVMYVDDKVAFTNRIYDINGKKWSIFGNNSSVYSDLTIKNP